MDTTTSLDCSTRKNALREQVWQAVEPFVDGPKPLQGRIPNFKGAKEAARNLTKTKEFRNAKVIKVHPSLNATSFREYVLRSGKTLLVPPLPGHDFLYFRVDSSSVRNEKYNWAAQKRGFNRIGVRLKLNEIPRIDLFVVAATVVSLEGCRAGKGKGYGEVEWAIAREIGAVDSSTPVATLVHDVQVVDSSNFSCDMMEPHDLPVDIIATPTQLLRCYTPRNRAKSSQNNFAPSSELSKPKGVLWDKIDNQMENDIGALKFLKSYTDKTQMKQESETSHSQTQVT